MQELLIIINNSNLYSVYRSQIQEVGKKMIPDQPLTVITQTNRHKLTVFYCITDLKKLWYQMGTKAGYDTCCKNLML